jgi:DNA repair protein RecO (recombination protein O)
MPAPRIYKTEAIILRHQDLGETDRIITAFTPRLGKVRFVAKGVKRLRSRMAGHLDLLCQSSLVLAHGRNLDIVTQAQVANQFLGIRGDLARIAQGLHVAELVDQFMAGNVEHGATFYLLQATLAHLGIPSPNLLALRRFEMRLLEEIGYRPQLTRCISCDDERLEPCYFTPSGGGVLCVSCRATEAVVRPLSIGALRLLRSLQARQEMRIVTSAEAAEEVEGVLRQYLVYLGERELHSAGFLDTLRRSGSESLVSAPLQHSTVAAQTQDTPLDH